MAVSTRVQPRYIFRMVAIAVVSIGLGIWGVLDYAVFIPREEMLYHRGQVVCQQVHEAFMAARAEDAGAAKVREEMTGAVDVLNAELKRLFELGLSEEEGEQPSAEAMLASVEEQNATEWLGILLLFREGLMRATRPEPTDQDLQIVDKAATLARNGVNETAGISKPGEFDRYVKGLLFVPCLPIGILMLWPIYRASKKRYVLEDDGTLRTPQGDLAPNEIEDIDMKRWMAKSIAYVETTTGQRIKLDDYVHKNVDVIVGAIASQKHPDEWTADARPRKEEEVPSEAIDPVPSGEADNPAA